MIPEIVPVINGLTKITTMAKGIAINSETKIPRVKINVSAITDTA